MPSPRISSSLAWLQHKLQHFYCSDPLYQPEVIWAPWMPPQNHLWWDKIHFLLQLQSSFSATALTKSGFGYAVMSLILASSERMGNTEFHVYKSQERQKGRKKIGFPRLPQLRQKSTTAAAVALLTDQVVFKVYRVVMQKLQQP